MVHLPFLAAISVALVAPTVAAARDEVPFADGSGGWTAAYNKAKAVVRGLEVVIAARVRKLMS